MRVMALLTAAGMLAAGSALAADAGPRAVTDAGALVGVVDKGANAFKGVPFAQPPVGDLRWKPPQAVKPWKGDRQATQFALPCPQPVNADRANGGGVSGATGEDASTSTSGPRRTPRTRR